MSDTRTVGQTAAATALALAAVILIALVDWQVEANFAAAEFYLIPVAAIAWYQGLRPGTWLVLVAAVLAFGLTPYATGDTDYTQRQYIAIFVHIIHLTIAVLIMSKLRSALDAERRLARIDPLTGLYNQREFYSRARVELDRSKRAQAPFTLAYLDLDDFKDINDRYGHREGDTVLKCAADALRSTVRSIDVAVRMGGDEFAVIMADTDEETATQVAERLRLAVAGASGDSTKPQDVTASVGVAVFQDSPDTVDEMLACADRLMYQAKVAGKDRVVIEHC